MPTLTPEQTFGFGSVPLTSYFKAPPGGSRNTMFSPQARAMLQQGEAYQREQDQIDEQQRQMDADQLVNELLGQAPNLSDDQINQALIQNPNIFRGRDAGMIQNYQQFRQQAATPADQKLGEYFYTKIQDDKDPRHLQNFKRRMLDEGMSANDAWEAYRRDGFNDQHANSLAELGVPDTEFDQLKNQDGYFDPTLVSRRASLAKADAEARKLGEKAHPLDAEIKFLDSSMEARRKHLEALQKPVAGDKVYTDLAAQREAKTAARSLAFNPVVAGQAPQQEISADGVEVRNINPTGFTPSAAPQAQATVVDMTQAPEHRAAAKAQVDKEIEVKKAQAAVDNEIASAWTEHKNTLQKEIEKKYSQKDLLGIASAILRGDPSPQIDTGGQSYETGGYQPSYAEYLLNKLGKDSSSSAFTEPQNNRWGTNEVSNDELLHEWAMQYQKEHAAKSKSGSSPSGQKVLPVAGSGSRTEYIPPSGGVTVRLLPP